MKTYLLIGTVLVLMLLSYSSFSSSEKSTVGQTKSFDVTYNIPGWNKSGNVNMKIYKQKNEETNVVYGVIEFINEQGKTISKITPNKIEVMISRLKALMNENNRSVESGLIIQKQINSLESQKEMLSDEFKLDAMMNMIEQSKINNKSGWDWSATFQSIRNQSRYASGHVE